MIMDSGLSQIIGSYSDSNPNEYTHCVLYPEQRKLAISQGHLTDFWKDYCSLVDNNDSGNFFLAEIPTKFSPVIVLFNFEFREGADMGEIYDEAFLMVLVKSFQDSIRDNLTISTSQEQVICCVMDSDDNFIDTKRNNIVVQIRLQFPYCRIEKGVFTNLIIPNAIENLRINNAFTYISQQPINDWDTIIQSNWINGSIPMYKGKAHPGYPTLLLKTIYGYITSQMLNTDMDVEAKEMDISDVFFPRTHQHIVSELIDINVFNHNEDIMFWLPMFFSVYYGSKITLPIKEKMGSSSINSYRLSMSSSARSPNSSDGDDNYQSIKTITDRLMELLESHRVDKLNFWLDIGKCLYNIYDGDEEGLTKWVRFTEKSEARESEDCEIYWTDFADDNCLDHRTIAWYALEDSPEEYERWHKSWYMPAIHKALCLTHLDVAEAFIRIFWLEMAYAPYDKGGDWYYFKNHHWRKSSNGADIRNAITRTYVRKVEGYRYYITQQHATCEDESEKERFNIIIKNSTELIKRLKNITYVSNIVRAAADRFYDIDQEFQSKLNTNDCVMGVRNGVLEVTDTECLFRSGKPQDYVSIHTPVAFPTHYTWETPQVKMLMNWYRQSFIDERVLQYKLKADASCLRGRNPDKLFPVWSGEVHNSKSMWKKLFDCAFGPYSADIPMSVLTGGQGKSSGPSPELAQLGTARVAFLSEPDDGTDFKNGILKMLTGGDSFFARFCRQDGGKTEARFKMFLICNKIPLIPSCDIAIKERFTLVPFLTTWVKKGAPTTEKERYDKRLFPQDKFFDKQIPRMAPAALWVWVQYYAKYATEGLDNPPEIIHHTENYWKENDIYHMFTNENIERVYLDMEKTQINSTASLSLQDIYSEFTKWFKDTYPGVKIPDRSSLKKELTLRWKSKPSVDNCWSGIQFKVAIATI